MDYAARTGTADPATEPRRRLPLDRLGVGCDAVVLDVGATFEEPLAREGLTPGVRVCVEAAAPFGGPLIVRVGRARLALARVVCREVGVSVEGVGALDRIPAQGSARPEGVDR